MSRLVLIASGALLGRCRAVTFCSLASQNPYLCASFTYNDYQTIPEFHSCAGKMMRLELRASWSKLFWEEIGFVHRVLLERPEARHMHQYVITTLEASTGRGLYRR